MTSFPITPGFTNDRVMKATNLFILFLSHLSIWLIAIPPPDLSLFRFRYTSTLELRNWILMNRHWDIWNGITITSRNCMTLLVINNWISTGVTSIAATTTEKKNLRCSSPSLAYSTLSYGFAGTSNRTLPLASSKSKSRSIRQIRIRLLSLWFDR